MANLTLGKSEDELVQMAVKEITSERLADFAIRLQTARTLWRQYRDLVEAPAFPEHLRAAFIAFHGDDPDEDNSDYGPPDEASIDKAELLSSAHQLAAAWIRIDWAELGQPPSQIV